MRYLTLLRHAKAEETAPAGGDKERALTDKGRQDALLMGKFIAQVAEVPDLIVSSTAVRTRQTIEAFVKGSGYGKAIRWEDSIYYPNNSDPLLAAVQALPDDAEHVLMVGHNPSLQELLTRLIGSDPRCADLGMDLATAGAAHIEFGVQSWAEVQDSSGQLQWLVRPKLLKKLVA